MSITNPLENLSAESRFLYWIRERHQIYLRRKAGKPKPWTDDEVLQSYFFTNPYRENDKVTQWFRKNIRGPYRGSPIILFATIAFRWFNWPPTGQLLKDRSLLIYWNEEEARNLLRKKADAGEQVFTGAYMISGKAYTGMRKTDCVCKLLSKVWQERNLLLDQFEAATTLEEAHGHLLRFTGLGGFMAYEIVCDLRYTYLLENATDKLTWCNPGPGAKRGLNRLLARPLKQKPKDWQPQVIKLLKVARRRLPKMPTLEMREIEHSLCEWDKYERARLQEGHMKRKYNGRA